MTTGSTAELGGPERDVAVIIPAAGAGVRMGAGVPKALRLLAGEPLLVHAVRRVVAARPVGSVIVAAPPGHEDSVRHLLAPPPPDDHELNARHARRVAHSAHDRHVEVTVVTGAAERQRSVAAALTRVPERFDVVLVHDAARALTPPTVVEGVVEAVRAGHDAVIPVLPVVDTITQVDPTGASLGHLDRSTLRAVQTPQGFRRAVLIRAHRAAAEAAATDDAGLVARLGVPVHTVPGSEAAFKITTSSDLAYAEALLASDPASHSPRSGPAGIDR